MKQHSDRKDKRVDHRPERAVVPDEQTTVGTPPELKTSRRGLVALGIDASGSMERDGKLEGANAGVAAIVAILAEEDAFDVTLAVFARDARLQLAPKSATTVVPADIAVAIADGEERNHTNISSALSVMRGVLERASRDGRYTHKPIAVLLSDGGHSPSSSPLAAASAIKAHATLVTIGYGVDAAFDLLREIATSPALAFTAVDPAQLRTLFATVGRTMSRARVTGQDVAALLAASRKDS